MFGVFSRAAARPAAAVAVAAAAANAAQGTAQARAPPQGARHVAAPPAQSKIIDRDAESWVIAEMKDEVVLFQPFNATELDEAASTVMALWDGRPLAYSNTIPIVTEPGEDSDDGRSSSSDDNMVNSVIEAAAPRSSEQRELEQLMAITTRMLRRPGMQREVVMCMMEDPDVRDLMLRQCGDLDRYLSAAGIHNPALLPPPETVTFTSDVNGHDTVQPPSGGTAGSSAESHTGKRGPPLVHRVAGVVASALERAGSTLAAVSKWMRGHFERLHSHFPYNGEEQAAEGGLGDVGEQLPAGRGSGARGQRKVDQVLMRVMALIVVVICVAVFRRPQVLRVLRR